MQTRTYGDLFKLIQSLAGVTAFATNEQDDIANLINRNYQVAYDTIQMWPRYLVSSEERDVGALVLSDFTSSVDQAFNDSYKVYGFTQQQGGSANGGTGRLQNTIYQSINDNTKFISRSYSGNNIADTTWEWQIGTFTFDPNDDGTVSIGGGSLRAEDKAGNGTIDEPWDVLLWTETNGSAETINVNQSTSIPYTQAPNPQIGEFIRIHKTKAFLNNSSLEYDFFVDFNGGNILNITSTNSTTAFVTYKKKFVPFTTSSSYTTSTEEVPGEFFQFIAYATYSDFLRMDGQHEKAQLEQENAQNYLALELERVDVIMNQNTVNKRFSTHLNRQSR